MPSIGQARQAWRGPGGVGEVLRVGYPLILSEISFTLQVFIDRLFLTWYSAEAVAGAVTGLFLTWSVIGLCIATGQYVTTFVAQYLGAGRPRRVGPAVWQGVYFALFAGLAIAALAPLARPVFDAAGHEPALRDYEVAYARVLLLGSAPIVLMATLAGFFAGRGRTQAILVVNVLATLVNAVLDYLWIFGYAGFPRGGVVGAAAATVTSQVFGCVLYLLLILSRSHRAEFATLSGWRLDPKLLWRLLRYGFPAGLQISMEIFAFALFMLIVGRLGAIPLAASGVAFNLNMLVFMPMFGLGLGLSSIVGRHLGAGRAEAAERATWSAFGVSLVYMCFWGAVYLLAPRLLLAPYAAGADASVFGEVQEIAVVLLRFVAVYSLFDMANVIFASALKGAGDTTRPLIATLGFAWLAMLLPAYLLCVRGDAGVYVAWTCASAYVLCVGLFMPARFRTGRWKAMRVIEAAPAPLPGLAARPELREPV